MAKKGKGREVAKRQENGRKKETTAEPPRLLSPLRTWEREIGRMFEDFPRLRWLRERDIDPLRYPHDMRIQGPSVDLYEENSDVVVKAELPGMSKEDIEVSLSDSTLTLKGEKKKEEEVKEKDYYRCEREYGSFLRTVSLPTDVKAEGVKAAFKNGVLEVRLPKSEQAKQKEVHIKVQ